MLEELIPALVDRFEIEPERIAIGGISMGGFGAYRHRPPAARSCSARSAATPPPSGRTPRDTAPGAFDDDDDFDRHDVIAAVGPPADPLAGKRVWLDVGDEDPFDDATRLSGRRSTRAAPRSRLHVGDGGHESSYWNSNWSRYMQFYARALKECQVDPEPEGGKEGAGKPDAEAQARRRGPRQAPAGGGSGSG